VLQIYGSPTASGASAVNWVANVDWNQIVWANLPSYATHTETTNAARSVTGASGTVWRAEWAAGDRDGSNNVATVYTELTNRINPAATLVFTNVSDPEANSFETLTLNGEQLIYRVYVEGELAGVNTIQPRSMRIASGSGRSGLLYGPQFVTYYDYDDGNLGAVFAFPSASGTIETQERVAGLLGGYAQTNYPHASLSGIGGAGTLHVSAGQTNLIATAWQNPASATNWTWTKTATEVTLTGYSGPAAVVIPDTLDNLPVTGFGTIFAGVAITSISGGANVTTLGNVAFYNCASLVYVNLPNVTTVADFEGIDEGAFANCSALLAVYFGQNVPSGGLGAYISTPNVTNYVTSPTATGWSSTWNGRPVVRMPLYTDAITVGGTNLQTLLDGKLGTNDLTAPIIAAAGGVTNGFYPLPGCLPLGTNTSFSITGSHTYYSATMAGVSTVTVTRAASQGFTYVLSIIGTNALVLSNATLLNQGGWTLGGTNTYIFSPTCAGTWVARGMTP
jgi:hypothetical protein